MTRYYHDLTTRTVYEEPEPWVEKRKGIFEVGTTVKRISGMNYQKADGSWSQDLHFPVTESYACPRAEAVRTFRGMHMGHRGREISKAEFDRLKAEYKTEAHANRPPS